MDFTLSDTQRMLEDAAQRFARDQAAATPQHGAGSSLDQWRQIADLGWLALPVSEVAGGLGGTLADMAVLLRNLGEGLVQAPLLTSYQAAWLLEGRDDTSLAALMSGESRFTVADGDHLRVDGTALQGVLRVVPDARADHLIVRANGRLWLASPADMQAYRLVDGSMAGDVTLTGDARLLGDDDGAFERARDRARLLGAAFISGAMAKIYAITGDYAATRQQFARALADNQVIQHRLVDLKMMAEEARALVEFAVMQVDDDPAALPRLAAICVSRIGRDGVRAGADGVQLHGGIGMTDEYPVGHYYKAAMAYDALYGSAAAQRRRLADMEVGDERAA